jgi:hypothetical protein
VKPLSINNIDSFLKRFDNFRGGELRSTEVISSSEIVVTLAAQDGARGFDWVSMKLEFSGVSDAKLLEEKKLSFVDMSDGISIINSGTDFAFGIGECDNISSIRNSICQVISSNLKYQEGLF